MFSLVVSYTDGKKETVKKWPMPTGRRMYVKLEDEYTCKSGQAMVEMYFWDATEKTAASFVLSDDGSRRRGVLVWQKYRITYHVDFHDGEDVNLLFLEMHDAGVENTRMTLKRKRKEIEQQLASLPAEPVFVCKLCKQKE